MQEKKSVAIIGNGYVGQAMHNVFKDHFDTLVIDKEYYVTIDGERIDFIDDAHRVRIKDSINENVSLAVICVPTPMNDDGSADLSILHHTINWLDTELILIKSTVPPNTTKTLIEDYGENIAFSPEYIGEGNYSVPYWKGYPDPKNAKLHDFVTIGGTPHTRVQIVEFFKTVMGAEPHYYLTDPTTAELVKYMENAYLATKVTFCNEFYDIAEAFGVNYDELREMWLADGRIGRSHTAVFTGNRGYGGKCLPKDTNAIVKKAEEVGASVDMLKAVIKVNSKYGNK